MRRQAGWTSLAALAAGVLVAAWLCAGPAAGPRADGQEGKKLTPLYFGVDACTQCHNKDKAIPDEEAILYRGTEMHTWFTHDKHKDATNVLSGERGRQMAKVLGYDVTTRRDCVSCHGVWVADEKHADPKTYKPGQRAKSGVSCVACHGAFREWVNEHAVVVGSRWQEFTRQEKEEQFGLRDLWDPAKRAALCLSCHVGNAEQGKVITHEMYAAGHPPLPGIEIVAFADAMPRHWETLTEKVTKRPQHRDFYKKAHGFDEKQQGTEQARMLAVSALVALRESARLTKWHAEQGGRKDDAWPELAVFDCYACHHDLRSESWRRERGYRGPPGRPLLRPWPLALARLSAEQTEGGAGGLDAKYKALEAVLHRTPFGEPGDVAKAAGELDAWLDQRVRELNGRPFERDHSSRLLTSLARRGANETLDFDSARQLGWGLKSLYGEAHGKAPDPAVDDALRRLTEQLRLELPKGQEEIVKEFLGKTLESIRGYDPKAFRATMGTVAEKLEGAKAR